MNKKSINLDINALIAYRDNICKTKTKYWHIIKTENVISKKDKKAGFGKYDLATLHNQIMQMSETLIKIKLMINMINMNTDISKPISFDFEEAKKSHYYNIFKASELKEQFTHWDDIQKKATINPAIKAKAGAKGTGKIETFSFQKIKAMKDKLQLAINDTDKKIADYNNKAILTITDGEIDMTAFAA